MKGSDMQYQQIGTTGIKASRVALGVMRLNGKSRQEASRVVGTVIDYGVDFFDTADIYGNGGSSLALKRALGDLNVSRGSIYLQTKVGIVSGQRYDFSKQHIVDAVDEELTRLGTDYVDLLLLHRPDTLVELDELAEAFNLLQQQGKVRHFGVSNVNPTQTELLQSAVSQKLHVNQLQFGLCHADMIRQEFHVNMSDAASIDHDGGTLAYTRLKHMTIQAWSPFQHGFFEGTFIDNPKFPELNDQLQRLGEKYGVSKNAIAVAWILRHPATIQVLLGSMNPERLTQMIDGANATLDRQEWYDLYVAAGNDLP